MNQMRSEAFLLSQIILRSSSIENKLKKKKRKNQKREMLQHLPDQTVEFIQSINFKKEKGLIALIK